MSSIEIITIFLIAAGGVLILAISLTMLTARSKKQLNYLNFMIFFFYGAAILCDMTYRPGTEYLTPHLIYMNYPLGFFLAPTVFIYLRMLLDDQFHLMKKHLLLFVPGFVILFLSMPYYFLDSTFKLAIYPVSSISYPFIGNLSVNFNYSLSIITLASFLFSLQSTCFLWKKTALTHIKIIRIVLLYMFGWIILSGLFVYSSYTNNVLLYRIAAICGNCMLFLYFIITYRDPEFFYKVQNESRKIKYQNSRLSGLNIERTMKQLDNLMIREELYRDSQMTLKELSHRLSISSYQLSEILNGNYNTNYNNFINTFRINHAKKMLIENPKGNILQTAFECGFNSKTTFNTAFSKNTGMSPSTYRKKKSSEL